MHLKKLKIELPFPQKIYVPLCSLNIIYNSSDMEATYVAIGRWTAMWETQETQIRFLSQENPLVEGMATHSSILAWRIP